MAAPLIQLKDVRLSFGGTALLDGVEFTLSAGERLCLVGRNGSGKSTLLRIAAGLIEPDGGTRFLQPGITVRYLAQEPDLSAAGSVLGYVEEGLGPADDRQRAQYLLDELRLDGHADPARLSGGEARRAALARALAPDPDVLLLDEPTNHLDLPTIEWLEHELDLRHSALVIISHDRRFLKNLSRGTLWLDRGRLRRDERGFSAFEAWRDEVLAEEQREQHKLGRKILAEENWLRYGVTARRKRNVGRLAALETLRQARRDFQGTPERPVLQAVQGDRSGTLVIEAERISKSYDGRAIIADFSMRIQRGDRIGIVGPNGSGKTTLLDLLIGKLAPDVGTVRLGANLVTAILDQRRQALAADATVAEFLTGGQGDTVMIGGRPRHVIGYMKDFLFPPERARSPIGVLSGGERARLLLAAALAKPSNLLVLDEPTNDLDLETLDVLEEMLAEYRGTILLVTHDRDFLDRVVNAVIAPHRRGRWLEYAGGYSDMPAQRGDDEEAHQGAARPAVLKEPAAPRLPKAVKRKLSFHEKHALEVLPGQIAEIETKIRDYQQQLADTTLYQRDRKTFEQISSALAHAQTDLAAAEQKWLELEILRENLAED